MPMLEKLKGEEEEFDMKQEPKTRDVYLLVINTLRLRLNVMSYTDLMGPFPITSSRGNQYLFVLYSYDLNGVVMDAMKSREDAEMARVYDKCYLQLKSRRIKLKFN